MGIDHLILSTNSLASSTHQISANLHPLFALDLFKQSLNLISRNGALVDAIHRLVDLGSFDLHVLKDLLKVADVRSDLQSIS